MKLKIRHKLFLTLLITSTTVSTCLFFYLQWSFDKGFLNYVNSQEIRLIQNLAEQLAPQYARHKSWQFARNFAIFSKPPRIALQDQIQEDDNCPNPMAPPNDLFFVPPLKQRGMLPRVVLFDAQKNKIAGGPPPGENRHPFTPSHLYPIKYNGEVIGYLGLLLPDEISQTGDLLFVAQQKETFVIITLAMIIISMLITFPVTVHFLRPIKELTKGTRHLIAGNFSPLIPIRSGDELGQLSIDFNILANVLDKNEKARRQWVADISHELRTPIAILRGEIEAMVDGIREPSRLTLDPLHSEILHLQRLVTDLYELSMSDIGALTYKKIKVDPAGILEECLDTFTNRFQEKGLQLLSHLPDIPCTPLLADPDRLQQLFSNILENSLRYTSSPGNCTVSLRETHNSVDISFDDTPPGVLPEQLPHLFDRLYRTDSSRKRSSSGAGLGLTICKNIVEAHQGTIFAQNSTQGGLAFHIHLPIHP